MSNRLTIRSEARADIKEAAHWYNGQVRGLGSEFLGELRACMSKIKEFPKAYPVVYNAARRALMNRFPYAVYYIIEDGDIIVFGCFHTSRDPSGWQKRV